jgi:2-succinyl-5-enolpyruvyl-6-hydroxy-3-cyclohexene-1-carboxylate synthase
MSGVASNRTWGQSLVDGLCQLGAGRFFLSPGARSAPLAAALSGHHVTTHYDERGMAFAALGWAMATGRPAVCVTTSGSAVANLLPACVEAFHSNVPLIFLTADRPPELRGTGANQTIHQPGLFGGFVRYAVDFPCAQDAGAMSRLSDVLSEVVAIAMGPQPGPVHLNVPIREPLLEGGVAAGDEKIEISRVANSFPFDWPSDFDFQRFASGRGVVVIGRLPVGEQERVSAILDLAKKLGWPVLADAASGARLRPGIIRHADWILQSHDVPPPERVLHFGGVLVSKRIAKWLSACRGVDCLQVRMFPERLDPWDQHPYFLRSGIQQFCESVKPFALPMAAENWTESWHRADVAVAATIEAELPTDDAISEPVILRALADVAAGTNWPVFLGNSMPIRDFDSCVAAVSSAVVNVFANRGASGIDGNIATVAGLALGCASPLLAVMGDLAALHDLNSLPLLHGLPVTLVIINNGGGGIFRFLPIDVEERLMETPHAWEFRGAAQQFGMDYHQVASLSELRRLLAERHAAPRILECRTYRGENHALHLRIAEACRALSLSWVD